MAYGVINEFEYCKRCKVDLLQDSIYSYEGYCHWCFPLSSDEEEFEIKCFSCLYFRLKNRWCNSPLGEFKFSYWKGDPCSFRPGCEFYRKRKEFTF